MKGDLTKKSIGGRDVARIVQRLVAAARLDGDFAAYSLRAGFVTSAASDQIFRTVIEDRQKSKAAKNSGGDSGLARRDLA